MIHIIFIQCYFNRPEVYFEVDSVGTGRKFNRLVKAVINTDMILMTCHGRSELTKRL